jgi:hypothetical protein
MSEQIELCVCGHPEESHQYDGRNEFGCEECGHAKCDEFRASLPWPTSEGVWWCDVAGLVEAKRTPSGQLWLDAYGDEGFDGEFQQEYGPARFTKLLEPNPYKS